MIDPEVKEDWLRALRSGAFRQAIGELHHIPHLTFDEGGRSDGYCCLGVLCAIMGQEQPDGKIRKYAREGEELSERFRDDIGLDKSAETTLIHMNDYGDSFDNIAAWIEKNL